MTRNNFRAYSDRLGSLLLFVAVMSAASTAFADDVDDSIAKLESDLIAAKEAALDESIKQARELVGDLVKKGDRREKALLEWVGTLELERAALRPDQKKLASLEKEFEAVEDRGGWWWLDEKNPVEGDALRRLDTTNKKFMYSVKAPNGKRVTHEPFNGTYRVMGLDPDDENIVVIEITYPAVGAEPAPKALFRFNRKTYRIDTPHGCFAKPVKPKRVP